MNLIDFTVFKFLSYRSDGWMDGNGWGGRGGYTEGDMDVNQEGRWVYSLCTDEKT